jgi:hypothetical protein
MKEEFNKDMERIKQTLEIKNVINQIKSTVEGHPPDYNKWKTESQDLKTK